MKILYISNHDLDSHSGVVNKIKSQVYEWNKMGHEVNVFCTSGLKLFDGNLKLIDSYSLSWKIFKKTSYAKVIILHFFSLLASFRFKPDIVYSRYFLYSPFLSVLYSIFPTVLEVNGDDKSELKNSLKLLKYYNLVTRNLIYLGVKGFVFVSDELRQKNFNPPISLVLPNGIKSSYSSAKVKVKSSDKVHIGFAGTENQNWHGIEKLVPFIIDSRNFHLHVIGLDGESNSNVTYYGKVDSKTNLEILSGCHVCVSTLALHRKDMQEASPLKSREYVLLGKPFVYAYDDFDLDPISLIRPDLFLKIPNTEDNVKDSWKEIESFLVSFLKKDLSEEIKKNVLPVISYENKEKSRIGFFRKVIRS